MLVPAIAYREELLKKFAKEIYSDRYFYYMGYGHAHNLPQIEDGNSDNIYQWAILDKDDKVIGWFAYRIYPDTRSVENFGLYTFEEDRSLVSNGFTLMEDVYPKIKEFAELYHRVSWRVIGGNPVERSYDRLLKELSANYETHKVTFHDITVDQYNKYHDEHTYEVINSNR